MHRNQEGFTLPEILIGLAISSIIIAASFASYIVIKQNYDFQKDMKNISQTSRAVATMIMRDVRMGGYNYDDGPAKQNPEIKDPVKIVDGGTNSADSIEIIYDKSHNDRLKISYYTKVYNNRSRLYKKVEKCNAMNCASGSLQTVIAESPIADYIEDFQLSGTNNGCPTGSNVFQPGCGVKGWYSPDSSAHPNDDFMNFPRQFRSGTLNRDLPCGSGGAAIDGDPTVMWKCGKIQHGPRKDYAVVSFQFTDPINVEKVRFGLYDEHAGTNAHGGSADKYVWQYSYDLYATNKQGNNWGPIIGKSSGSIKSTIKHNDPPITWPIEKGITFNTANEFTLVVGKFKGSIYDSNNNHLSTSGGQHGYLPEISFYGEKFSGSAVTQTVEVSLLIRSPEEHGSSPVSQTWNIGNRSITTNDNYIRDTYSISTLVRNLYFD